MKIDSTQYLFSAIRTISVGKEKTIYVADASDNTIRVYNKHGNFVKKIGRRGRGPGEFLQVTFLQKSDNGQLIALDRFQNRVSFFDASGNFTHSVSLGSETLGASHLFYQNKQGHFYLVRSDQTSEQNKSFLLHQYDQSLKEKQEEYIDAFEHFFDSSDPLQVRIAKVPIYKAALYGDNIAVVPGIYSGQISTFNTNNGSEKNLGQPVSNMVTLYDWDSREKYRESDEVGFASSSGQEGNFFFKRKGSSFGLIGNDKFLLYFYGIFDENQIIPYVDVYNSNGEFLKNIPLKNQPVSFISSDNKFSFVPHFLDEENNLYASDYYYKNSFPAVRVFKTNLNELLE
ncbi:6-bladed beta-propeller [Gracilimonas sp.]|uniref:6-bladed beta-propeller n=1 Tax=Gracilimonas sp. TaxID=1974203 RepID=UPI002870D439|nr:6-bladed beta-propeller [Gracilimonas sp.]